MTIVRRWSDLSRILDYLFPDAIVPLADETRPFFDIQACGLVSYSEIAFVVAIRSRGKNVETIVFACGQLDLLSVGNYRVCFRRRRESKGHARVVDLLRQHLRGQRFALRLRRPIVRAVEASGGGLVNECRDRHLIGQLHRSKLRSSDLLRSRADSQGERSRLIRGEGSYELSTLYMRRTQRLLLRVDLARRSHRRCEREVHIVLRFSIKLYCPQNDLIAVLSFLERQQTNAAVVHLH